jgi:hypothetical protein
MAIDEDQKPVMVPFQLLADCFNEIGDCLCFPSGQKAQDELLSKLAAILEANDSTKP